MVKARPREDGSTRADRKFEKKVQFYRKVRDTVASLSVQKAIPKKTKAQRRKKKLQAYDLSSLSESLPELKARREPKLADLKLNSKTRQKLVLKESNQLQIVTNHPAFQSNPLQAIYQHLQSTSPKSNPLQDIYQRLLSTPPKSNPLQDIYQNLLSTPPTDNKKPKRDKKKKSKSQLMEI